MKSITIIIITSFVTPLCLVAQTNYTGREIPIDTSYTVYQSYIKIRDTFPEAKPAMAILPKGVVADRDLVYTILTDSIYKGRNISRCNFHGGGWHSGDKTMQEPMAMQIAANGYVTVAVEYQLSHEAQYPNAVYNIKSAVRWMRANANKYSIDTGRIAISGCSAGGNLAALIGMTGEIAKFEGNMGNTNYPSSIQAVIDIDGVLDFMAPAWLNMERKPTSNDVTWLGCTFLEKPAIWKEASPIFWVNKKSPPVMFLNSGFSRYHAGQDEMIGMMNELGIYNEVHKFKVKLHPFWLFHPWFNPTVEFMVKFLNKVFKS